MKKTFFSHDKNFYAALFPLLIIISLPNLISYSVNMADNIMLGAYSQNALSGAALVNQDFFAPKYSLVSFITVPDKRNTAIKFGMDISPLNVSAILHNNPKSTVAPRIATSE